MFKVLKTANMFVV